MTLKRSPPKQGKGLVRSVSAFTEHRSALARVTALAPGEGLRRGKPLAAKSKRRQAEDDGPWLVTKAAIDARDGGRCQIGRFFPDHRCSFGRHRHHVTPAKHGGDRLDPVNVATVCWSGHIFIHDGIGWQAFRDVWVPLGLLRDDSDRYGDTSGGDNAA